jgi:hypothetical protein
MDELLLMNKEDRVRLEEINYRLSSVRPRTTAEKNTLMLIDEPHAYDILMGKLGNVIANRPGNLALRQICWLYKKHHTDTNTSTNTKELTTTDSHVLARQVISHIQQMNPNVRFLVKSKTTSSGINGRWKDCGEDDMLEKARLLLFRKDITKYPVETKSSSSSSSSLSSLSSTKQATEKASVSVSASVSGKASASASASASGKTSSSSSNSIEKMDPSSLEQSLSKEERSQLNDLARKLSSSKPRTLHVKGEPQDYDVVLGKAHTYHPGNLAFRQLIWLYRHCLDSTSTREHARSTCLHLVSHMTTLNPTMRFLLGKQYGRWTDASQDDVLEKAIRALERAAKGVTGNPFVVRAAPIAMPTILYNVLSRPLNENDVVFVGAKAADHPSNKTFHQLVANNVSDFDKAPWYVLFLVSHISVPYIFSSHTRCVLGRTSFSLPIELWIK